MEKEENTESCEATIFVTMFYEPSLISGEMELDGRFDGRSEVVRTPFTTVGVAGWVTASGPKVMNAWLESHEANSFLLTANSSTSTRFAEERSEAIRIK